MAGHGNLYLGKAALLIQKIQNAVLLLNQVEHILVVNKLNVAPVNLLLLILSLYGICCQVDCTGTTKVSATSWLLSLLLRLRSGIFHW